MAFVALLDILGFVRISKNLPLDKLAGLMGAENVGLMLDLATAIEVPAPEEVKEGYVRILLKKAQQAPKRCEILRFSDTILLYRMDEGPDAFGSIVWSTGAAIRWLMRKGLPLRGAITRGELHVSQDRSLYLGEALVAAYELAQRQAWAGAVVDPKGIPVETFSRWYDALDSIRWLQRYKAPMKDGEVQDFWCVNWPEPGTRSAEVQEAMTRYNPHPDWPAQRKIDETLRFIEAVPRFDPRQ